MNTEAEGTKATGTKPMGAKVTGTKPMNTGGWIARADKPAAVKPAVSVFSANKNDRATKNDRSAPFDSSSIPVLVLHGFTGNAESMTPLIDRLISERPTNTRPTAADDHPTDGNSSSDNSHKDRSPTVIAVDLVGHGATQSPPDVGRYSLGSFVKSLDAVLADALGTGKSTDDSTDDSTDNNTDNSGASTSGGAKPVHIVGYSLGGRMALTYACHRPQNCASLTLIGASPGIADPQQRLARRRSDYDLANQIARGGIRRFITEWTSQPMWHSLRKRIGEPAWQASLAQRARSHPLGLAHSLRGAGSGAMVPLWDQLAVLDVPTLVLAGEEDTKYCEIGAQMSQQIPSSDFVAVPDAGHAAHLEQPENVANLISAHIGRTAKSVS